MLHLGTDAGFRNCIDVDGRFVLARMLLQGFTLPGRSAISQSTSTSASSSRCGAPLGSRHRLRQIAPLHESQITQLIEVMLVGRGGDRAVGQATLCIDTNVGLHAKVPLMPFWSDASPDRVDALCSGRAGCLNDGGIHQSALVIMTPAEPASD